MQHTSTAPLGTTFMGSKQGKEQRIQNDTEATCSLFIFWCGRHLYGEETVGIRIFKDRVMC